MKVFGYIRFSYFGRNDTKIGRAELEEAERLDALYNPERMAERLYFLENITLPSLRFQTDPDFKVIVAASTIMPDVYKASLEQACADIPQIEIIYSDADHITDALNPKVEELTSGIEQKTVHFRMDDDDAISAYTISRLKRLGEHAVPNTLISMPRGFYLAHDGTDSFLLRKFEPYIAIAWALVNAPGQIRNPYQGRHRGYYELNPSIMDPRPHSYIHVAHNSSDTRARQGRKLRKAISTDPNFETERARNRVERLIRREFPTFTPEKLKQIVADAPSAGVSTED